MADSNKKYTRAQEKARIQGIIAENRAATANATATSNATASISTAQSSAVTQPPTTASSSTPTAPSTTVQPSPASKSKTSTKIAKPKTSSKSAGRKPLVYNPDIDSETEECINVLPRPTTPVKKQKVSRRNAEKVTTSTPVSINDELWASGQDATGHSIELTPSSSGTINNESRAPDQTTTELNRPTIKLRPHKETSNPETQAPIDITALTLQDSPDDTPEIPSQYVGTPERSTGQRRQHLAYPNLPPGVPVDDEGIRKFTFLVQHV
jgi:hypothetical protein